MEIRSEEEKNTLARYIKSFEVDYSRLVLNPLLQRFGMASWRWPPPIGSFTLKLARLLEIVQTNFNQPYPYLYHHDTIAGADLDPLMKLIILTERRKLAVEVESRRAKTGNPYVADSLDALLNCFGVWMEEKWIQKTEALTMPRLSEYFTLEELEKVRQEQHIQLEPRKYDEKFGILQAPTLLYPDLVYYRGACSDRGIPLALAYVDIDRFKDLNTKYGHHIVDRDVLPVFMRALEAFVFSSGYAYRFGGDEYAVLIPNGRRAAGAFEELCKNQHSLSYSGIEEKTTVSVGVCVIDPDSFLTERETIERANRAMIHAKSRRNSVATYKGSMLRDEDLIFAGE
jgi:diguanylate cyclase (GGDEF)-like protein